MTPSKTLQLDVSAAETHRIFAAIELSKSTWVVSVLLPRVDKISLYRIAGGDIMRLVALLDRARDRAEVPVKICTCYEAGYDGFWIHRALVARGIENTVLDAASIQVSRRGRRVKTDRTDAESLVRVLVALYRGDHKVARAVRVPTPQEEDDKRRLRCRNNLLRERIRHANRIRRLLHLQGVRHIDPNRGGWTAALKGLRTGDGRLFPSQLLREIRREAKLLASVKQMLAEVEIEIAEMIRTTIRRRRPAPRGRNHPIAAQLASIRGIGPQIAGILATEVYYRRFRNRREVASYLGLTPTPYNSGNVVRDQGISKAGNRRARTAAIELAWIWLRNQPDSALSQWFQTRVGDSRGRVRRIAIVALARKLMVALWRYLEDGLVPEGARMKI